MEKGESRKDSKGRSPTTNVCEEVEKGDMANRYVGSGNEKEITFHRGPPPLLRTPVESTPLPPAPRIPMFLIKVVIFIRHLYTINLEKYKK